AFVNPPYSNAGPWLKRCAYWGCRLPVIALVNVCTGTTYWAAHVWPHAAAICFPKGRIAFLRDGKPVKGNRYEQALILYSDSLAVRERFVNTMSKLGQVVLPVRGEAA
ncbi:MAG: DNA N-6-adenine-methyltransferase, partial [Mycobacterium sp.]